MRRDVHRYLLEAPFIWFSVIAISASIFVADTVTDLEIAFAVLYVSVILISVGSGRPRAVLAVGVACVLLTVSSYLLTAHGDRESGFVNCALSLLAIGATTYLAIRIGWVEAWARRTQSELARMSRVMVISELGASITHEVSQPVTAIAANGNAALRWLAAPTPNQDEARRAIERIVKDADRAGEVIGRVRRLVTRTPPSRNRINMAEVIAEALALIRNEIRSNHVLLRTEFADDLPTVSGDRVQLQQVVLNIVINAIEAMGTIDAEMRNVLVNATVDGKNIIVSVRDSGTGVAPSDVDRIFEAFHTTKAAGTGMGLAISRSIVEAHGGAICAAPNYPHGAAISFTLPLDVKARG